MCKKCLMALLPDFVEYYHMHVVVCGEECKKYKRALKKINMLVYMQVMSDEEIDGRDTYYELGAIKNEMKKN